MSDSKNQIPEELNQIWKDHNDARNACFKWGKKNGISMYIVRSTLTGKKRKMQLGCKHFGQPANKEVCYNKEDHQSSQDPKSFVANDKGEIINATDPKNNNKERQTFSQRIGCKFLIVFRPVHAQSQQWRVVSFYGGEHSHQFVQELSTYPMLCRLDDDEKIVINMIKSHPTNNSIISFLAAKSKIVDPKDITNLRQTIFNNDPDHTMFKLISKLQEKGYKVKWQSKQEGDKRFLLLLFFAHQSAIDLAHKFSEVIVMDATYKTNRHRLPFVNIVGTGNISYPRLKTFCIAGGWVLQETNESYEWVVTQLWDTVWPSHQLISPQTFVTDNESALDDYENLEKAVNFLMTDQYVDQLSGMSVIPDHLLENKAIDKYKEIAQKARKPEDVIKYLDEKLEVREKWVGTDIAYVKHFGNNSTNRVEGSHANLKSSIQSSSANLYSVFEQIDKYYRLKNLAWKRQHDKESLDVDPHFPEDHKERLAQLERNISKFAFYSIRNELKHRNIIKTDICRCAIKVHYNISCCHMLPSIGTIPLSLVPRRWHLYPERTVPEENITRNNNDIIAVTEPYVLPSIEDEINDELARITGLLYQYPNQQQRTTLLHRLRAISDDLFLDIEELQQPKTLAKRGDGKSQKTNSKKRNLIELEHQDLESKKKAKTAFGRESAEIWEGKQDTLDNTQPTNQLPPTPSIKLRIAPNLNLVTDLISPFAVETVHNPAADGNCGFRALAFKLFGILNPQENQWFCAPECTQIAAHIFQTPVALFDGFQFNMYIPLRVNPLDAKRTHPIVLQLKNNHIILIKIKPGLHIQWPILYPEPRGHKEEVLTADLWYDIFKDVFDRSIKILPEFATIPDNTDISSIHSSDSETAVDLTI
ncbi:hypothetical protein INT45_001991 [Circinella minor]|uniref:MULE transposase domain-containing protein n=1 Tax=Circinella minor TaxID=1195481 RepID=A0A8H7VF02_9FUNG|nr:hypothetical protein INT45_001991 [Circinella minor]